MTSSSALVFCSWTFFSGSEGSPKQQVPLNAITKVTQKSST